jgi:hypothetical protein
MNNSSEKKLLIAKGGSNQGLNEGSCRFELAGKIKYYFFNNVF